MRNKLSVVLFTAFLFVMFLSATLVNAADYKHPRTTFRADRAPKFMVPFEQYTGARSSSVGEVSLGYREPPPTNSPGGRAGLTTYDYQKNGSMGRLVAGNSVANYVFMVWMAQDNYTIPGDRGIKAQAYDVSIADYVLDAGGTKVTDPDYAGYTTCGWGPNNEAAFACHVDPGTSIYKTTYYWDGLPNNFIFYNYACDAYNDSSWYSDQIIWPIMSVHEGDNPNVTEDVVYILSHVWTDSEDLVLYRQVAGVWDSGQYIETVTDLSYLIEADANSDMVVVVYTDDMHEYTSEGAGGQTDLDVYYRLSTDQGDNWGPPVCVSNYSEIDDSLWRAYSDLSAVITADGYLHIIAPVRELRSQTSYENYKSRLVHWDIDLATETISKASVIDEARYYMSLGPNRPCDPDAWNLYIAKPSVSYCDGKLYALYTKFGDDNEPGALGDCSQAGFANGELYLAASDDNGATWDTAWNLTKTRTPLCDSSQCESDHWSSMAAYGMAYDGADDTLDIIYINDKDAGGIPQGSGTWCVNNVMHYRFPCRAVAHIPKISLEPTQFVDPTHTAPGVPLDVVLKVSNIGNDPLIVSSIVAEDSAGVNPPWIYINKNSFTVGLQSFELVTITLNYNGILTTDMTSYDATIAIDHNAPSDIDYVEVSLTVAEDWDPVEEGTLNTTCKQLQVFNTARLGGDTDGASLDIPGDCDSIDATPATLIYLFDASPVIAWNNGEGNLTYTTMFTQDFTESGTFRPQSALNMYSETDYDMAACTVTTSDSLYGIAINLYAPTDGNNCFIIGTYEFFNWNPVKDAGEVYLGFICDWDIPSDNSVDNGGGYDATRNTMWQFGGEYEDDNETACASQILETDRLGGLTVLQGPVLNGWSAENAPNQIGSAYDPDWLFAQMSTLTGYNTQYNTDTTIDLHTGTTFEAVDMTIDTSYSYVVALVTTNAGESDYLDQVDSARVWAVAHGLVVDFVCDCRPGDANGDGQVNVGDAVYIISYVFKGGAAPTPYPRCSGDANGDCQCNVGDAVYIISYVFKGGAAPVSCDTWHTTCGDLGK